ncbi:MAG TPA: hypothetical protein DCY56_04885 [Candidatus Omnitrophica bacterium]|nr:hypothetical protein [Candidatus Omnitrophota bacterium]
MVKIFYRNLLKFFLRLYDFAYQKINSVAIRYYGMHPKHKFNDFHKFFIDRIPNDARVLDIGCSRGELTVDLATKASYVAAYDISEEAIKSAIKNRSRQNINYFVGEATNNMPQEQFDIAVCSNVLEHLEDSDVFLKKLNAIAKKVLIRVPNFDNNWILGVKKDLKMEYFLDPQHRREYVVDSIKKELNNTGWIIESMEASTEIRIMAGRKS